MDRIVRRIALWITVIVSVFALYVVIDCIRLRDSDNFTKPFLTLSEEYKDNSITYNGLGYKVVYWISKFDADGCYGAEFYVFDDYLVWGWIE